MFMQRDFAGGAASRIDLKRTSAGTVFAASSTSRPTTGLIKSTLLKKISAWLSQAK